jgi:hypothetical protein
MKQHAADQELADKYNVKIAKPGGGKGASSPPELAGLGINETPVTDKTDAEKEAA